MTQTLIKREGLLKALDELRFRITTIDQAAEALIFSKQLKDFAKLIEEKVKKRGSEIMTEKDLQVLEVPGFQIMKINPTMLREYKASSIIEAVGMERANALLKVDNGKVNEYMRKQGMTPEEMAKATVEMKMKPKKGYIKISEKKDDKSLHQISHLGDKIGGDQPETYQGRSAD